MPAPGRWRVRLNSDAPVYAADYGGRDTNDADTRDEPLDDQEQRLTLGIGPYSMVVLSQDP